ncbi:FMRFamide receptor-like [Aplysia californica]|uniref:FMRFamide receptor-like n=1 Tax=Aplysia californica TaxID=6500 RepID=A0ABM1A7D3_APLCA|nr:FMRFamide receptor-like [Aplysia californica]
MKAILDLHPSSQFPFLVPPLRDCLTATPPCTMGLGPKNETAYWNEISDYFCFLALPVIVSFAFLTEVMSVLVLARQVRQSLDTYLLGLSLATLLLLTCSALLAAQHYAGPHWILVHAQPYAASCRDWFWYSGIWLLVMMSFERVLTVSASRASTLCSSAQAAVVVVMVFAVGLVSSLPRFWEYQAVTAVDPATNLTKLVAEKTVSTATEEYNIMYFWYVKAVTLFVPFLMMLLMSVALACRTRRSVLTKRYMCIKHTSGLTLNRKIKEEASLSHLLILLMSLYMFCSVPGGTIELVAHLAPAWVDPSSRFYVSFYNLFTVVFFFQFALHLIIYFCFNKQFRITLLALFCCCC